MIRNSLNEHDAYADMASQIGEKLAHKLSIGDKAIANAELPAVGPTPRLRPGT